MPDSTYKILLMGPQGSGKGTQAELLSKALGLPALSMGQLLRDEIAAGTELGRKVDDIIKGGSLVSDVDAAAVLRARLERPDAAKGYVLDGYPRNESQLAAFDFDSPTHVIVIDLPKEESLRRLAGRLTCDACGKVYRMDEGHEVGEACACGTGKLIQRDDDTPEAIEKRLDIYEEDTVPVIAGYEGKGLVRRIDGTGNPKEVQERIREAIA